MNLKGIKCNILGKIQLHRCELCSYGYTGVWVKRVHKRLVLECDNGSSSMNVMTVLSKSREPKVREHIGSFIRDGKDYLKEVHTGGVLKCPISRKVKKKWGIPLIQRRNKWTS